MTEWKKPELWQIPWFNRVPPGRRTKNKFVSDGWILAKGLISKEACNEVNLDMDPIWHLNPKEPRIHGLFTQVKSISDIAFSRQMVYSVSDLFLCESELITPAYSINFQYGSKQELHQDSAVFHSYPGNWFVGAWVALQDIHPDSGPLQVLSGSHRESFPWPNYPQTNLRTAGPELTKQYRQWINEKAKQYTPEAPIMNQGDVLFWHADLFHGGAPIVDRSKTRRSLVLHYFLDGTDVRNQIQGPFNWQ